MSGVNCDSKRGAALIEKQNNNNFTGSEHSGNLRNGSNDGPAHVNARNRLGRRNWNIAARI